MNKLKLVVIGFLAVALLVSGVYAANTVMKPNNKYEAMLSSTLHVTGSIVLVEENNGFVVIHADGAGIGTDPAEPSEFGTDIMACTAWTADDWVYDIRLFTTETTPANAVFEVEFRGPAGMYVADVYVSTGATVVPGTEMFCIFGIGPELAVPYPYRLTVQRIS